MQELIELAEKLAGISDEQKLAEFLKENEVDFTTEQFKAFILEKAKQSGEIPEEEFDAAAGGNRTQDEPLHKFVIKLPS